MDIQSNKKNREKIENNLKDSRIANRIHSFITNNFHNSCLYC